MYIPPENSSYTQKNMGVNDSPLNILNSEIQKYTKRGYVVILGDLNARVGTLNDYIQNDTDKFLDHTLTYRADAPMRSHRSQDSTTTPRGHELIDLCIGNHLHILNGRKVGDCLGYFTCHKFNGSSTVDYIIVSEELVSRIHYFHIHSLLGSLSDHCKLSCYIRCNNILYKACDEKLIIKTPPKFKWNSIPAFQNTLTRPDIVKMIDELRLTEFDETENGINNFVNSFHSVIIATGESSLKKRLSKVNPLALGKRNPGLTCILVK